MRMRSLATLRRFNVLAATLCVGALVQMACSDSPTAATLTDAGSRSDAAVDPGQTADSGVGDAAKQSCKGTTCSSAPPKACLDAQTLRTYAAAGTCENDVCSYSHTDTKCANGCVSGACIGEPCAGVVCNTPPSATCTGAATLKSYGAAGTCSGGTCSYAATTTSCLCRAGACAVLPAASSIAANAAKHMCITTQGGVNCWGDNTESQLGNRSTQWSAVPVDSGLGLAVAVAVGWNSTCALTTAGGVKCLGANFFGGLGNGTTVSSQTPVDVVGLSSGVSAISAGAEFACALTVQGGVKCWGYNNNGMLGNNSFVNAVAPVDVVGLSSGVVAISGHFAHTCAVTSAGAVFCWGDATYGKLGTGGPRSPVPGQVVGISSGAVSVTTANQHSCALMSNGTVKCWGYNQNGQLGDGVVSEKSLTPVDVSDLTDAISVSAGMYNTCAVTSSGAVKCWGGNSFKQLGNDSAVVQSNVPVEVQGLGGPASQISVGEYFACAVMTTGTVKCWGRNANGTLGNNMSATAAVPTTVYGYP